MSKTFDNKYRVNYSDSDFCGRIAIPKLGNYILDIAGLHACELDISMQQLAENDLTWVMSGIHFNIYELPKINSFIDIHTKISSCTKVTSKRDFFLTCEGRKVADVSSEWLIINTKTRRPVFLTDVFPTVFDLTSEEATCVEKYKHLRFNLEDAKPLITNKITYSDIDINTHLYSMKYLEMSLNLLDLDFFKTKNIKQIDMNFISEILYNQEVEMYLQDSGNCKQIEMRRNQKATFRTEIEFCDKLPETA